MESSSFPWFATHVNPRERLGDVDTEKKRLSLFHSSYIVSLVETHCATDPAELHNKNILDHMNVTCMCLNSALSISLSESHLAQYDSVQVTWRKSTGGSLKIDQFTSSSSQQDSVDFLSIHRRSNSTTTASASLILLQPLRKKEKKEKKKAEISFSLRMKCFVTPASVPL